MSMFERWCHHSITLDKSYAQSAYNTEPVNTDAYFRAEQRNWQKVLERHGGREVWRVSPTMRRVCDGAKLTETNLLFADGSAGDWMPCALTPDRAAVYYGVENQVN
jgi:prepilin-type processing-associated H-X9-DG protein